MDWPHDPDSEQASEGRRKYGIAIIAKKIDEQEDFPIEKDAFVAEYGNHPVRLDRDRVVSVADIFEHVEGDTFEDFPELHRALGDALRRGGYRERPVNLTQ